MATTTKDILAHFSLDDGTTMSFTIPDYDPAITDANLKTALDAIVATGIIAYGGHAAVRCIDATKVDTVKTDVEGFTV